MLRLRSSAATAFATAIGRRFVKSTDDTYEDDRWLEAELANKPEMTAEERYAAMKQHELLKKMMAKLREKSEAQINEIKQNDENRKIVRDMQVSALKDAIEKAKAKLNQSESTNK
jgi:acyl-homoserine lactone acylase PvdQ